MDPETVRLETETLCYSILCTMPAMQYVSLHLLEDSCNKNSHTALGPFGMLRNMRSVNIHGVPLPFADRLKGLMLGNTTPEYESDV